MSSARFRSPAIGVTEEASGLENIANRYALRVGGREVKVRPGETVIGLADDCEIVIAQSRVSQQHARVVLTSDGLAIEDLGSISGTLLNGSELGDRRPLKVGDRITVGATHIEVVERAQAARPSTKSPRRDSRRSVPVTPSIARLARWASSKPPRRESPRPDQQASTRTVNLETFESAGRLADRMFSAGRPHAACRILEEPLRDICEAARHGALLDAALVDTVGRYAVKLAHEVLDARWVDFAVEIHANAGRPLRETTLRAVTLLGEKGPQLNKRLMALYNERLQSRLMSMDAAEQRLCEHVVAFVSTLLVTP